MRASRYGGRVAFPIAALRRYPVKSMGGESLLAADLDGRGIVGDRWYAVRDGAGHFASGKDTRRFRRYDGVFDYSAVTGPDGVVVTGPEGSWPVGDPELDRVLASALTVPVTVVTERSVPHFDAGSVSLVGAATLRWCTEQFGIDADPRRLRVNVVVDSDEPFAEEAWVGRDLRIGTALLRGVERIERCRTIDVAQDGTPADGRWLKPLAAARDMCVALYAEVITPGSIRIGDQVEVG